MDLRVVIFDENDTELRTVRVYQDGSDSEGADAIEAFLRGKYDVEFPPAVPDVPRFGWPFTSICHTCVEKCACKMQKRLLKWREVVEAAGSYALVSEDDKHEHEIDPPELDGDGHVKWCPEYHDGKHAIGDCPPHEENTQ